MPGAQLFDYDPATADILAPEVRADPYPYFAWLRRHAPVLWHEQLDAWLVTRYADVARIAREPGLFSSIAMRRQAPGKERTDSGVSSVITCDPPEHTRLRNILQDEFRMRPLRELEPRVQALVGELAGSLRAATRFDLVRDFTIPLPVTVIAELLDIEPSRHADFKHWSDCLIKVLNDRAGPAWERARQGVFELIDYFRAVFETRGAQFEGRADILSVLLRAERDGRIKRREMIAYSTLLLTGGNETTTNLIGGMVIALLERPQQLRALRDDPSRIGNAIEEGLRFCSPVQGVYRRALEDIELAGQRISAGSDIVLLLASANHDEAKFADPDEFDITRHCGGHVGFGIGIHHCLGAHLGRLETRIALERVLPLLQQWEPAFEQPQWNDNWFVRGPERLEFDWRA